MSTPETITALDTSAVLAFLTREPGWQFVQEKLQNSRCILSTVNLVELVSKLVLRNAASLSRIEELTGLLGIELIDLNRSTAMQAGLLTGTTRSKGLSLGDRACLALAIDYQAEVLTSDLAWFALDLPVRITNFRQQA